MAENGLIEQIKLMIEKAERSLDAAKNLINDGDYEISTALVSAIKKYLIENGFLIKTAE